MLDDIQVLSRGNYLQFVVEITLLDDAIIRSNEPEEVLTHTYNELGNRFILPWRKTKGKLRRAIMEKLRGLKIAPDCYLKDNLCMQCPACLMFGGTGEVSQSKVSYNLLSRVMGDTFISAEKVGEISPYTANAVDEKTLSTGQALMSILKVPVETIFRGVVTLRDPTPALASILADGLGKLTRLGASTREWGRVETAIRGYRLADREELSSYSLARDDGLPDDLSPLGEANLPQPDEACKTVSEQVTKMLEKENLAEQTAKGRGKSS
jgi:CRISPR type I-D-associated protein Csc2